jgi:hypothetical protein
VETLETLEWLIEHTDISRMLRNRNNDLENQVSFILPELQLRVEIYVSSMIKVEKCPAPADFFLPSIAAKGGHVHFLEWRSKT